MKWKVEGSVAMVLREIWKRDGFLMEHCPALDEDLTRNDRFFADGAPQWVSGDTFPEKCVIVDDFGDELVTRASGCREERSAGLRVRILSPASRLTSKLAEVYQEQIDKNVADYECDQGVIGDYVLSSQRFARTDGGLRLWQGQFEFTLHRSRSLCLPMVVVSHV